MPETCLGLQQVPQGQGPLQLIAKDVISGRWMHITDIYGGWLFRPRVLVFRFHWTSAEHIHNAHGLLACSLE